MISNARFPTWFWFVVLILWTGLLIAPGDWFGDQGSKKVGGIGVGKMLHVGCFAFLAGSAGWLRWPLRWRLAVIPLLILHGGFTEMMQTIVPLREGSLRDVGIDATGVLLGFLSTWWWWPA